ncbi:unnamed protein product, partial [Laminaria digitata]
KKDLEPCHDIVVSLKFASAEDLRIVFLVRVVPYDFYRQTERERTGPVAQGCQTAAHQTETKHPNPFTIDPPLVPWRPPTTAVTSRLVTSHSARRLRCEKA